MEIWGGIECTINRVGNQYFDQLSYDRQYHRLDQLEYISSLGISKIRFPILWEKQQENLQHPIFWAVEAHLEYLRTQKIEVIAGLMHHGSGPVGANVMDDHFPEKLAQYAGEVAKKFHWINYYTPVNEPLTTARFCGLYGIWHPHGKDDNCFLKILINECKASILAMKEIRKTNPKAHFVFTEDLAHIHSTHKLRYQADFENERRWLSIDLVCGKVNHQHSLWNYLLENGVDEKSLLFFIENPTPPDVLGFNYYITSERFLDEDLSLYPNHTHGGNGKQHYFDIEAVRSDKTSLKGLSYLLTLAWERYQIPLAVTEIHLHCGREDQLRWLHQAWLSVNELITKGIDIKAITFWSLLGSYGWDKLLTNHGGTYEPGAFEINGQGIRHTAISQLISILSSGAKYSHPLLASPGWWQRAIRLPNHQLNMSSVVECTNSSPVLILGAKGSLGAAFAKCCAYRGIPYRPSVRTELDLADIGQINAAIEKYRPWAIINAAGFSNIDQAEHQFDECYLSNTIGPSLLAKVCQQKGIKLVSFSSDLVFDGTKGECYLENDFINPINNYGRSQANSERLILEQCPNTLLIRSSNFFGQGNGLDPFDEMLQQLKRGNTFKVANDIYVSPTYLTEFVNITINLLIDDEFGIFHLTNDTSMNLFDLAREIAIRNNLDKSKLISVPQDDLRLRAKRPKHSGLQTQRGISFPSLEKALDKCYTGRFSA